MGLVHEDLIWTTWTPTFWQSIDKPKWKDRECVHVMYKKWMSFVSYQHWCGIVVSFSKQQSWKLFRCFTGENTVMIGKKKTKNVEFQPQNVREIMTFNKVAFVSSDFSQPGSAFRWTGPGGSIVLAVRLQKTGWWLKKPTPLKNGTMIIWLVVYSGL